MKHTDKVKGLKAKARALEDSFFAKENERILQELRASVELEEKKKEFRATLNVENEELIETLIDLEVDPETLVAFSLVPLVEVAWADGEIQENERKAIVQAAIENGVTGDSPTVALLENWLQTKPGPELFEAWQRYMTDLMDSIGDRSKDHVKAALIGSARSIAEAAGGFLGMASISAAEKKKLAELELVLG